MYLMIFLPRFFDNSKDYAGIDIITINAQVVYEVEDYFHNLLNFNNYQKRLKL